MWRMTINQDGSSALGMTAQTLRRKVQVLQRSMDMNATDIQRILEMQPTLLQLSAQENLQPTLNFLQQHLCLDDDDDDDKNKNNNLLRTLVLSSPSILTYSIPTIQAKLDFFIQWMGVDSTRKLLQQEPKLLRCSVESGLQPRFHFLTHDLEMSRTTVAKIVQKNPRILLYSLDANLIPKLVFYLILTLQMEPVQVERVLLSFPQIVDYNLEQHILPISRYFQQDLEFRTDDVRRMVLKFPRLFSYALRRIQHTTGFFRYEMELSAAQTCRVLFQAPQVVGLKEESIRTKFGFLETICPHPANVTLLVAGMPTLLCLSVETNLRPKRDFLMQSFAYDRQLLGTAVMRLPTLFGYSLEKRIQPRMQAILSAGLDPGRITVGIPMTRTKFEGWLKRQTKKSSVQTRAFRALPPARDDESLSIVPRKQDDSEREPPRVIHWRRPSP